MKTKKQRIINGIFVAVMLVLSLFFLFPVIWMIANSFKQDAAITADMNSVRALLREKGFSITTRKSYSIPAFSAIC